MATKLEPCPFCGGRAHMQRLADSDGFGTFYYVVCTVCRAQSGSQYASKGNDCPQTYAEVRDLWNRRAAGVRVLGDAQRLLADLDHRVRYWRQPGIGDFPPKDLAEDFAQELERAGAALRAAGERSSRPIEETANRCGCNYWLTKPCPSGNCPWQGKRPVDAGVTAAPAPSIYDALPPSAMDWLTSSDQPCAASQEWRDGWDACRNRVRTQVDRAVAAGVQGGEGQQ